MMKRFSILEEMERLAVGETEGTRQAQSKQQTIDSFFISPMPSEKSTHTCQLASHSQPVKSISTNIPQLTESTTIYHIFTDGSCINNGRKGAKAAYAAVFLGTSEQGPIQFEISQSVLNTEPQTNQRAELSAIYHAVQIVQERSIWKEASKICFWTDSQYAIKCITEWGPGWQLKGWKKRDGKPIEHLDLLKPLIQLRSEKGPKFTLRYVEAHQGAARSQQFPWRYNARADTLAQAAT